MPWVRPGHFPVLHPKQHKQTRPTREWAGQTGQRTPRYELEVIGSTPRCGSRVVFGPFVEHSVGPCAERVVVPTEIMMKAMEVETQDYLQAELSRRLPARRIGRPAELDAMSMSMSMSMYLCGPAVSWATHQIITVDGAV
jgi:hypothetical protein